jgi:hypothetical protein
VETKVAGAVPWHAVPDAVKSMVSPFAAVSVAVETNPTPQPLGPVAVLDPLKRPLADVGPLNGAAEGA